MMATTRPEVLPAELLDHTPPHTPEARASRRDLRIFNRLLGNHAWLTRVVEFHLRPGERVLELGAGDGSFAMAQNRRGILWDGLDQVPAPQGWPADSNWLEEVLPGERWAGKYGVIVANLVLHHFDEAALARIGALMSQSARLIAAGDLWRGQFYEKTFGLAAAAIGAHPISRHDGRLSIRAGFQDDELPRALGLDANTWTWTISKGLTGAYRMLAKRRV